MFIINSWPLQHYRSLHCSDAHLGHFSCMSQLQECYCFLEYIIHSVIQAVIQSAIEEVELHGVSERLVAIVVVDNHQSFRIVVVDRLMAIDGITLLDSFRFDTGSFSLNSKLQSYLNLNQRDA